MEREPMKRTLLPALLAFTLGLAASSANAQVLVGTVYGHNALGLNTVTLNYVLNGHKGLNTTLVFKKFQIKKATLKEVTVQFMENLYTARMFKNINKTPVTAVLGTKGTFKLMGFGKLLANYAVNFQSAPMLLKASATTAMPLQANGTLSGVYETKLASLLKSYSGPGTATYVLKADPNAVTNYLTVGKLVGTSSLFQGVNHDAPPAPFASNGGYFSVTYAYVPEPGICALLIGGVLGVIGFVKHRRRSV